MKVSFNGLTIRARNGSNSLLPVGELERFVLEQIGCDPRVLAETVKRARAQEKERLREHRRLLQLLIERVDDDGRDGTISITFHPSGIKALADRTIDGDAA